MIFSKTGTDFSWLFSQFIIVLSHFPWSSLLILFVDCFFWIAFYNLLDSMKENLYGMHLCCCLQHPSLQILHSQLHASNRKEEKSLEENRCSQNILGNCNLLLKAMTLINLMTLIYLYICIPFYFYSR